MVFVEIERNSKKLRLTLNRQLMFKEIIEISLFLRKDYRKCIEEKLIESVKNILNKNIAELKINNEIKDIIKNEYKIKSEFRISIKKQYEIRELNNDNIKYESFLNIEEYCNDNNYLIEKTNSNGNVVYEIYKFNNNGYLDHIQNITEIVNVENSLIVSAIPERRNIVLNIKEE